MAEMPEHEMRAMYGPYSMERESSGTAWQPDASPQTGIHGMYGEWSTMTHGMVNLVYDHQGGARGDTKTFSTSMLMLMAQRPVGEGTFGLRGMVSADPLMGKRGYPLLLQTGESANGQPLIDRAEVFDLEPFSGLQCGGQRENNAQRQTESHRCSFNHVNLQATENPRGWSSSTLAGSSLGTSR